MQDIPRDVAVRIERQWYDPVALSRWLDERDVVPHTRRPPTMEQRREIARKAAAWAARQGIRSPTARSPAGGSPGSSPRRHVVPYTLDDTDDLYRLYRRAASRRPTAMKAPRRDR